MFRTAVVLIGLAALLVASATRPTLAQDSPTGEAMHGEAMTAASEGHLHHGARPDGQAPVAIMGDHVHMKGKTMLSYRYMRMEMDGNRGGSDDISTADVLKRFPVAPTNMTMEMHMFGAMYAPTDEVNLMVMAPYVEKSMDHVTRKGIRFTTESEGLGDVTLTGMIKLFDNGAHRVNLNAGLSFPTGSIDERDATPADPNARLPYPMQIGSGTYDLLPGMTYTGFSRHYSWGAQASGAIRIGRNDRDYALGDRVNLTAWGARPLKRWLSASLRMAWQARADIDGADPALDPAMVQTADPDRQGGQRLDLVFGLNALLPSSMPGRNRLGVEFGVPVYQDLNGPQLETDWTITAGWILVF
jgi:hypothetical protein